MTSLWLVQTKEESTYSCPICRTNWQYTGPLNPFRWQCPSCSTWLTWRDTEQMEAHSVKVCIKCSNDMELIAGQNGPFWGCSNYPDCKSYQWRDDWRLRPVKRIDIATEK